MCMYYVTENRAPEKLESAHLRLGILRTNAAVQMTELCENTQTRPRRRLTLSEHASYSIDLIPEQQVPSGELDEPLGLAVRVCKMMMSV